MIRCRYKRLTGTSDIEPSTEQIEIVGILFTPGTGNSTLVLYADTAATVGEEVLTMKGEANDPSIPFFPSMPFKLVKSDGSIAVGGHITLAGAAAEATIFYK